jgi:hypothetical protein
MLNFMTDIFRNIDDYNPHLWIWLGDAAYTDDLKSFCKNISNLIANFKDKADNSMPLDHVMERFQITENDPRNSLIEITDFFFG